MSRQSAAALAVVPIGKTRLMPAGDLSPEQEKLWRRLIGSMPPGHFHPSDEPLLRSYVEVTERVQMAQAQLAKGVVNKRGKVSPWLKIYDGSVRLQASLASRLRLAPQARVDRRKAGAAVRADAAAGPWDAGPD
jgi:phage terminase small subunit